MVHVIFNIAIRQVRSWHVSAKFDRMPWSTCRRLVLKKDGNNAFILRKRAVTIFRLLHGLWSVRTRFRHYRQPCRSCKKNMSVSPSFSVRVGQDVKPRCFDIRIESMVLAAFVRGRISVRSYQPRDRNTRKGPTSS